MALRRRQTGSSYTVTYDSKRQWAILTQAWGSPWRKVWPYCLANTAFMATLHWLQNHGIDLNISESGHTFLSIAMAFLIVSRITTSLARYDGAREYLEIMNKASRQLVHTVCVYSNADTSESAKQWRFEVTYRTLLLLRTAMAVIDYPDCLQSAKEVPELSGSERLDLQQHLPPDRWLHEARTDYEENLRIPVRLSYLLRKSIRSQERRLSPTIPVIAEGDLYAFVNLFMDGYHGVTKFLTTPTPFPLIQLSSTFLWFYLFTVPFALLSADDRSWVADISHCMVVFILTFAFMGMELISIQLDDPFGEDTNDFNNLALAQMAFEDAYLTIQEVDGLEWADRLRGNMNDGPKAKVAVEPDELTWLKNEQHS